MNAGNASVLLALAGAWALQALLFVDFAAEARRQRRPERPRVDLLDWSNDQ